MSVTNEVIAAIDAELEGQRCLTERQEVEMQRQRDLLEAQLHFATALQADLNALRGLADGAGPSTTEPPTNVSGHDRDTAG